MSLAKNENTVHDGAMSVFIPRLMLTSQRQIECGGMRHVGIGSADPSTVIQFNKL